MTFPNQLAPKQITNLDKTRPHDCRILQKRLSKDLSDDFRLAILGNKKVLEKSQIESRQILMPSLPSRNKFLVIEFKNCIFYYSFEELVTMGASFKTVIIYVACKKGDYFLKYLEVSH